jgi:MFS family permease
LAQFTTTLAPLQVRDFRLLFGGQMISTIGDMFYMVALPWLMLSSGRNPQELGIVLAAYGVPRVATLLFGGWLSDRLGPRTVMLLSDLARAVLGGVLAAEAYGGYTTVLPLSLVSAPLGAFTGVFLPAYYSILPEILSEEQLPAGNALNGSSFQLAVLVGSGVAGFVVSLLTPAAALVVDALTFAVSTVTLFAMQKRRKRKTSTDLPSESSDLAEASRFGASTTFGQLLKEWRLLHVGLLIMV